MGNFERYTIKTLHDISFMDGKSLLGKIMISAEIHLTESWGHLNKSERAGPENRRIVENLERITVIGHGSKAETKPSKEIQAIMDEIKANKGIVAGVGTAETKSIVNVQDPAFEAAFRERMKSSKYTIEFRKGL